MTQLMIYVVLIGSLAGLAAVFAERLCADLGRPRRGIWIAALGLSVALPAVAVMTSREPGPTDAAARVETGQTPGRTTREADPAAAVPGAAEPAANGTAGGVTDPDGPGPGGWRQLESWYAAASWSRLDDALAIVWIASSAGLLLFYGLALLGLRRAMRRWPAQRVGADELLISDRIGPAVVGFLRPRIVVPEWLLAKPAGLREMVLRHERAHAARKDPLLLAAALLLLALAPFNPTLWWQLRRLRLAIEIDCDARVVGSGADAAAYSRMLLAIRRGRVLAPLTAVSLTESVSLLERRIRALLGARPAKPALGIAGAIAAAALVGAALSITPPETTFGQSADAIPLLPSGRQSITMMRLGNERAVILVDASASMLDRTEAGVARYLSLGDSERRDAPKWRQLLGIVDALAARIQPGARFQIFVFSDEARAVVPGTDSQWLTASDRASIGRATRRLREATTPAGQSNLQAALAAAAALEPAPEAIYLVTDGLPSAGPVRGEVTGVAGLDRFRTATEAAPDGAAINVILLPVASDGLSDAESRAAGAYWSLALPTGGAVLAPADEPAAEPILGLPLDGEYLIFVIDTSPSMKRFEWDRVMQLMRETLEVYPTVKGLQVMNDEGEHLFLASRNQWLDDSPQQRARILEALEDFDAFSNSNPRRGIVEAISRYFDPGKRIALFVYGDDLASGSGTVGAIVREVETRNRPNPDGVRMVRIHGIAFPVYWDAQGSFDGSGETDYAALMRVLAERSGGAFVALPGRRYD